MIEVDKNKYYQYFSGEINEKCKSINCETNTMQTTPGMLDEDQIQKRYESALENALDIRKFEIDLYWKRATYFWTFIGVIFAGYFLLLKEANSNYLMHFITNCLGLAFSFCWVLVNKGSKFWQSNWEKHVDMLEDKIHGPLYKTIIIDKVNLSPLSVAEYPFSVTKVNTYLSMYVCFIWVLISLNTIGRYLLFERRWIDVPQNGFNYYPINWASVLDWRTNIAFIIFGLSTLLFCRLVYYNARTGFIKKHYEEQKQEQKDKDTTKAVMRGLPLK